MSFLQAMEKLGYNPYHMFKAVMSPNGQDLRVMKEAIEAQRPHSSLMPYSRADYDKWFKSYDVRHQLSLFHMRSQYADKGSV